MRDLNYLAAGLFSSGQIAAIVILCFFAAALIGVVVWFAYLLHKRGEHKLYTAQLQRQREALMAKLEAMRSGEKVEVYGAIISGVANYDVKIKEEEDEDSEVVDEASDDDEEEVAATEVEIDETGKAVRYNRSFTARIIQANNDLKARYSELKNYILSYSGIAAKMSWRSETFHTGRKDVISFVIRGKTLCVCMATDIALFEGTKYKLEYSSAKKNSMPCRYRITSDRKTGYAKELIDIVMAGFGLERKADYFAQDFTLPYKSTETLIKRRLIKIAGSFIPDSERDDALAAAKKIRYNRSFKARILQSDDVLKNNYSKLKNYILGHDGVKAYESWRTETFTVSYNNVLAAFVIRGKTLCLCLAIDPERLNGTKYKVENLALRVQETQTPTLYRIKSSRKLSYAMQLIDRLFAEKGIGKIARQDENYAVPFVATETLIRRGLIKVVKESGASVGEAEVAATE